MARTNETCPYWNACQQIEGLQCQLLAKLDHIKRVPAEQYQEEIAAIVSHESLFKYCPNRSRVGIPQRMYIDSERRTA